jgi:hypothetical protein
MHACVWIFLNVNDMIFGALLLALGSVLLLLNSEVVCTNLALAQTSQAYLDPVSSSIIGLKD